MSAFPLIQSRRLTHDEYFALLDRSEEKWEYENGRVYAVAGGTGNHSRVKFDVGVALAGKIGDGPYQPYDSDMAVLIPKYNSYVFPDLSFVCEKATFDDPAHRRLLNPALLIEVISDSSEAYDRGKKFQKYRSLESFREYLLIDSRRYAVESWYREEPGLWRMDSAFSPKESVHLFTLNVDLPLADIYRRVELSEENSDDSIK